MTLSFRAIGISLAVIAFSSTVSAQDDAANPTAEAALVPVIRALYGYLPDPQGIRDMRICEPTHVRRERDGRLKGYTATIMLNAPNAQGGMSGQRVMYVIVREKKSTVMESSFPQAGSNGSEPSGIMGLLGDKAIRDAKACPKVSEEKLKAALTLVQAE